jgi:NAD(P)-dependent dehydrogenase (short-subunit alcohol dehydrogenase family)
MPTVIPPVGTQIRGSRVLVTGGHRGFGRALVYELLSRGAAEVFATSRMPFESDDRRIVPIVMDVADDDSVRRAALIATDISILVNNAGVALNTPVLTASISDMRSELETNLFGIVRLARAFAPVLAASPPSSLLNVLSVMSWLSTGRGYEISKSAAWSATNALRLALHDQGITVTALHVSYMDTGMTARLDVPKSDPRIIAGYACDGIERGDSEVLADEHTQQVKQLLSGEIADLYPNISLPRFDISKETA